MYHDMQQAISPEAEIDLGSGDVVMLFDDQPDGTSILTISKKTEDRIALPLIAEMRVTNVKTILKRIGYQQPDGTSLRLVSANPTMTPETALKHYGPNLVGYFKLRFTSTAEIFGLPLRSRSGSEVHLLLAE